MMKSVLGGAVGMAATVPMTFAMSQMYRRLPATKKDKLPPRKITMAAARKIGLVKPADETTKKTAALTSHFSFGSAMGTLYSQVGTKLPGPPVVKGIAFGFAVWAGNYLGLLPAAKLYKKPEDEPQSRKALMIAAHCVWGGVTGLLYERLTRRRR